MQPANPLNTPATGIRPSHATGLLASLRSTDFRKLWLATVASQVGLGMQQVLLGWLVLAMTGSDAMVGVIFAVRSAPNLIVGLGIGALADHLDRRALMRWSVIGMMLASLLVSGFLFGDRLVVWQLLLYTGILGTLQAFNVTSRQVYVVDVLGSDGALRGLALISAAQRVGGAVGALVAGAVLQGWGAGTSFLLMGLSYGIGACLLCRLRDRGTAAPMQREPLRQNLAAYGRALRSNRVMRSLMLSTAAAETLGFSHQVMLPILAKEVLHVGASGLGVLTAFRFVGGILGVALITLLGEVKQRGSLLLGVLICFSIGQLLLAQATHFWPAVLCVVLVNVMASATDILHHTLLQYSVPNEQRGRAMGSWIVGIGTAPVGHLEIGYLASLTSVQMALSINGLALAVLTLILAVGMPRLRRL